MKSTRFLGPLPLQEDERVWVRVLRGVDWWLLIFVFLLMGYGLLGIFSAVSRFGDAGGYYGRQIFAAMLGLGGMVFLALLNYQVFRHFTYTLFGFLVAILVGVLLFGTTVRGSKSWYNLHFFSFQPAELGKILIIVILAGYLDKNAKTIRRWKTLVVPVTLVLAIVGLILLQPDFSSSLGYFPILLGMLFAAGARPLHLAAFCSVGAVGLGLPLLDTYIKMHFGAGPKPPVWEHLASALAGGWPAVFAVAGVLLAITLIWVFLWQWQIRIHRFYLFCTLGVVLVSFFASVPVRHSLKNYQQKRLIVFLDPEKDPFGSGYNLIQSKVAIGSGRFFGKGLFSGTQSQLGFLPEQHTDFIFSVISEELGFIGAGFLVVVFGLFFWRCVALSEASYDRFGSLIAVGVLCLFVFPVVLNIGMVMGMMPVTGVALPFLSYGGSQMVCSLLAVGLLLSVAVRRYMYY